MLDIEGARPRCSATAGTYWTPSARVYVEYHSFACQPQTFPTLVDVLVGAGFRIHLQPCSVARQPFLNARQLPAWTCKSMCSGSAT
jgi:hypothetical protein